MPRCTAVTSIGKRCRCNATAGSERCANHATAQTYGLRTPSADETAAYRAEILRGDAEYQSFHNAYYKTLRELYNSAEAEIDIEMEYVLYRVYGLGNYNKMHEKQKKGFLELVKKDNPNSYYALFMHIERRRQAKRQAKRQQPKPKSICPICSSECYPEDEEGHCSYSCASGGGY